MKLELRSVRIKNCGPIDDIKIDFFDASGKTLPVCVIGGANGSGKTTVLEALSSLFEIFGKGMDSGFIRPYFENRRAFYLQADLRISNLGEVSFYAGGIPVDASLRKDCFEIYQATSSRTHGQPLSELQKKIHQQQKAAFINGHSGSEEDSFPTVIYLPHNRSLEPVTSTQIHKEDMGYHFFHRFKTVRQFPGSLNSYLIWLDYAEPEMYASIHEFLNSLSSDGKTFEVERKALNVVVRTVNGQKHWLHDLSSGEQNLLIVLIELRRRLRPGSIVLIDEIENSLHPAYQHRLAQGLLALQKEIPYQLIVTTHAPAFVEIFGEENTRLLTPF